VISLRPRVAGDVAGLVSIACDVRSAYVQFWRSVFERCAPQSTALVEAELGAELKQAASTLVAGPVSGQMRTFTARAALDTYASSRMTTDAILRGRQTVWCAHRA
jgi:hypothetical protein